MTHFLHSHHLVQSTWHISIQVECYISEWNIGGFSRVAPSSGGSRISRIFSQKPAWKWKKLDREVCAPPTNPLFVGGCFVGGLKTIKIDTTENKSYHHILKYIQLHVLAHIHSVIHRHISTGTDVQTIIDCFGIDVLAVMARELRVMKHLFRLFVWSSLTNQHQAT